MVQMVDTHSGLPGSSGAGQAVSGLRNVGGWVTRVIDLLLDFQERARQRRHLSGLDDHLLRDIGVSRSDVDAEVTKPFWKA